MLVRQSLKLCQNASYPRCHPDLNDLERDKTNVERRNHLLTTSAFKEAAFPYPVSFSWSIFFYQWWQVSIKPSVAEKGGGVGSEAKGRRGVRNMKHSWTIAPERFLSVCGLGKRSLFLFSLLISNLLFTPFYKLESLCCPKGSKTNRCSARIKLLCCQWLAGLLAVLTSSATAECQMIQEILVLYWPKPYESLK